MASNKFSLQEKQNSYFSIFNLDFLANLHSLGCRRVFSIQGEHTSAISDVTIYNQSSTIEPDSINLRIKLFKLFGMVWQRALGYGPSDCSHNNRLIMAVGKRKMRCVKLREILSFFFSDNADLHCLRGGGGGMGVKWVRHCN